MENINLPYLSQDDPELARLVSDEKKRLSNTLNLIAAENHSFQSIMEIIGSDFNTKTIEGLPGKRFHSGCVNADKVENLAIERARLLFKAEHVNVQPLSGTLANIAVYFSVLNPQDRILSMGLPYGGHLSHGHSASVTSRCFKFSYYKLNPETELIDYDQIREQALSFRPKMIVAGASSYPRLIDYKKIAAIAREISAYFTVDMAHLAGLVAAGVIPSPIPHCDFATFTCYKTMMGGRGGVILCRQAYQKQIDNSVFPGCQGTSPVNFIAAKALIFKLAADQRFKIIQKKSLENAQTLARALKKKGYRLVTNGSDNHQILVDLTSKQITGQSAEKCLESVGIILNRNVIPADAQSPGNVSGIRIGTSAVSARGMEDSHMEQIVELMDLAVINQTRKKILNQVQNSVLKLCSEFPIKKTWAESV